VRITVPRDRKSAFEPQIVVKGQRRVGQVDEMILSLYARGMTTRDIHAHLAEIYGVEVSPALVSAVTDVVSDEITEWQNRPLDAFYAILYIDALVVKVRDGGAVDNKAAYLVTGVDVDGFKHVLGIWLAAAEGCQVLDAGLLRNQEPRYPGRADGGLRWAERPAGRGQCRLGAAPSAKQPRHGGRSALYAA
jgi:putative transposase